MFYCTALHWTALSCTALHCTALHCTALHCTALHCTALHCTALHCTALHCTALHCTSRHCTELHCTALHCTALHCTALHCTWSTDRKVNWIQKSKYVKPTFSTPMVRADQFVYIAVGRAVPCSSSSSVKPSAVNYRTVLCSAAQWKSVFLHMQCTAVCCSANTVQMFTESCLKLMHFTGQHRTELQFTEDH